jgi:hypothetical protein
MALRSPTHSTRAAASSSKRNPRTPREQEATCRGAAALALVEHGALGSLSDAALLNQPEVVTYQPLKTDAAAARYQLFETYLARLYPSTN